MALNAVLFVSKRLQLVVAALVCLAFVELASAATERTAAGQTVVKVAISRQHG